jgi:hypothetical protein
MGRGDNLKDPYKILQIDPDAETAVIEAAYRGLARCYHPDVNPSSEAAERMTDINWAYEILHDPEKREAFRQSWRDDKKKSTESSGSHGQTNQSEGQAKAKQRTEENVNQEAYNILCQSCGLIGPTKKFSFRYNIGLLFIRRNMHIEGKLCRNCIEDYFWKYTAIYLFLGWWGLISFFVTPFYILENLISYVSALNLKRREDKHGVRALEWKILIGVPIRSICLYLSGPYLAPLKPDISNLMRISFLFTRTYTPTNVSIPTIAVSQTSPPTATPSFNIGSKRAIPKNLMTQVYVPAREFLMGSDKSKDPNAKNDELPQHIVYLDAFWIDQTEVTNAQYGRCVADGQCTPPYGLESATRPSYYGNSVYTEYPVIYVGLNEAQAYCAWAGGLLPSEAE